VILALAQLPAQFPGLKERGAEFFVPLIARLLLSVTVDLKIDIAKLLKPDGKTD
jgi:hypothetical protein